MPVAISELLVSSALGLAYMKQKENPENATLPCPLGPEPLASLLPSLHISESCVCVMGNVQVFEL